MKQKGNHLNHLNHLRCDYSIFIIKYTDIKYNMSSSASASPSALRMKAVTGFTERLKNEAEFKRANKRAETRRNANRPSSPSTNMAQQLLQLGQMYKDGLLTKEEFTKAKAELF